MTTTPRAGYFGADQAPDGLFTKGGPVSARMTMPVPRDAPIYRTPCGPVAGWIDGPVIRATGIPYATAERFCEPVPVLNRTDLLVATTWSPACPQNESPLVR